MHDYPRALGVVKRGGGSSPRRARDGPPRFLLDAMPRGGVNRGVMHPAPAFAALFGRPPLVLAEAPGRVNLIGEHTDYNDGFVLPALIPQRTRVELAPRDDDTVCVASALSRGEPLSFALGSEAPRRDW